MARLAFVNIVCVVLIVLVTGCTEKESLQPSRVPEKRYSIDLDDTNYKQEIQSGVSVIDFWAAWCPPCGPMGENVEVVAEKLQGKIKFFKINVDDAREAARSFNVTLLPTLWIVVDGQPVQQSAGLISVEQILTLLKDYTEEKKD